MDPFGFAKTVIDKWDILTTSPSAFFAVLGFGFFLGLAITRAFLNERLARQQMRIADLEKVLDGKLSASFLPLPRKQGARMSVGLVLIFAGIGAALVGAVLVTSNRSPRPASQSSIAPVVLPLGQPSTEASANSVLLSSRYYSAKNKEEVAAFLDKISDVINKPAEEMLLLARQALGGYLFSRPNEAQLYLQRMDEIKAIAARIDVSLYDEMLGNEREYRQEMNAILFPKDPLIKFRTAIDAYRNGLSVWIKLRNNDDDKARELQVLVAASQQSFTSARDEFLTWLSQRQDIISQTRRALRS